MGQDPLGAWLTFRRNHSPAVSTAAGEAGRADIALRLEPGRRADAAYAVGGLTPPAPWDIDLAPDRKRGGVHGGRRVRYISTHGDCEYASGRSTTW